VVYLRGSTSCSSLDRKNQTGQLHFDWVALWKFCIWTFAHLRISLAQLIVYLVSGFALERGLALKLLILRRVWCLSLIRTKSVVWLNLVRRVPTSWSFRSWTLPVRSWHVHLLTSTSCGRLALTSLSKRDEGRVGAVNMAVELGSAFNFLLSSTERCELWAISSWKRPDKD
jgi:hypothetical protein